MSGSDKGIVLFEVALIAVAVVLVEDIGVRVAMACVPAMLLAQRAMAAGVAEDTNPGVANSIPDRRTDQDTRQRADELLKHFREFYATCHLVGGGGISVAEAQERITLLEKKLNLLLARLTLAVRQPTGL